MISIQKFSVSHPLALSQRGEVSSQFIHKSKPKGGSQLKGTFHSTEGDRWTWWEFSKKTLYVVPGRGEVWSLTPQLCEEYAVHGGGEEEVGGQGWQATTPCRRGFGI